LAAGITLLRDGEPQAITFSLQGNTVRVLPSAALSPETDYTLTVGLAVQDLQGYGLTSQVSVTFQTAVITLPDSIDPRRLRVIEPNPTTGLARVEGLSGAVPGEVTVTVENTSQPIGTVSTTAAQDGSFSLDIEAALGDRLQMIVLLEGGTAPVFWLPPFLSSDLQAGYVGARAESFTTGDDITVTLDEGTFDQPTWVRIASELTTAAPIPAPDLLPALTAFALDFGGATPNRRLHLNLPAPANPGAGPYLLNRYVDVLGRQGWMMHDLMELEEGRFVTSTPSAGAASQASRAPGGVNKSFAQDAALSQAFILGKSGEGAQPRDFVTGVVAAGRYQATRSIQPLGHIVFPPAGLNEVLVSSPSFGGSPMLGLANPGLLAFMPNGLIMPTLLTTPVDLTITDLTTGFELFRDTLPASSEPLVTLPPDLFGDVQPPVLLSGSPLGFYHLQTAADGVTTLAPGLTLEVAGTTLTVTGDPDATVEAGEIVILGLDGNTAGGSGSASFTAAADGSFNAVLEIVRGHRYLLAIEGELHVEGTLELAFSEALATPVSGIQVRRQPVDLPIDLAISPRGDGSILELDPINGWTVGDYVLEINSGLEDAVGNAWPRTLRVPFTVVGSSLSDSLATGSVQDAATLGSLVFVATLQNGLRVVDASNPGDLQNYLPNNLSFTFPLQEATRGVAVDPHGRVYVSGGGAATFGQLKILDPLAIDLEAIAADPAARTAAWRGSTLLSDPVTGTDTVLPAGFPRRLALMSNDDRSSWTFDPAAPPAGVIFSPSAPPDDASYVLTLTVAGDASREGLPVTLRNRTRGSWHRVDAGANGDAVFQIVMEQTALSSSLTGDLYVSPGEELELLRNRDAFAYVAIDGVGLAVIDANAFYGENSQDFSDPNIASGALSFFPGFQGQLPICDPAVPVVERTPLDVGVLLDLDHPHPLTIPTLLHRYGLGVMKASSPQAPQNLESLSHHCAAISNTAVMGGMAILQAYPMDLDGDGILAADEVRDYVVVTNASVGATDPTGWVMVFDLTDRAAPQLVGRIEMPSPISTIAADRANRRLVVAGLGDGLHIVDFDRPPSLEVLDADADGRDDRVLETLTITGESVTELALVPELGLVFAGGQNLGLSSITVAPPELAIVGAHGGPPRAASKLAPFGVPTSSTSEAAEPGLVRIEARLPGGLADANGELRLDLLSVGPGGVEIDDAGDPAIYQDVPPTRYLGNDGIVLRRLSDRPHDQGYGIFVSQPVVLLADLRASVYYDQTSAELASCSRCDLVAEGVYSAAELSGGAEFHPELLSGHRIAVRFPEAFRVATGELYSPAALDQAQIAVASVPWDISPAVRQEPRLNPSYGTGDVAPGTLLHSGEMSHGVTDLAIAGRGFDFAFERTYRNQIVGGGPLGPGWDFGYRMRLRELPNGDVEYFDGRGRRERFAAGADGYQAPAGLFVELRQTSAGWLMISPAFDKYRFDPFGRLESISDVLKQGEGSGNELRFFYDLHSRLVRVTDTLHGEAGPDRSIHLEYDPAGRLIRITDFTGRAFEYAYDPQGRLSEFRTPEVETHVAPAFGGQISQLVKTYAYEDPAGEVCADANRCLADRLNRGNNLIDWTDAKGHSWLSVSYEDRDGDQRAEEVASQDWGDDSLSLTYYFAARTAAVVDRRSNTCSYLFNAAGQTLRVDDPAGEVWLYEIDDEGLRTRQQLPLGGATATAYDLASGRRSRSNALTVTVTPDGRGANGSSETLVSTFEYHAKTNRPTRVVGPRGSVTVIERTETGLETRLIRAQGSPEESVVTLPADPHYLAYGQPIRQINPNGHTTRYAYFPAGHASHGYLESIVVDPDGLDLSTRFETDPRGNVVAVIDPRGVRSTRTYNALDWPIQSRAAVTGSNDGAPPLGYTSHTRYDRNGNVSEVLRPFADGTEHTRIRRRHGILDQVLEVQAEVMPGDPIADWPTTRYDYDANLNLIRVTDPEGNVTETTYDARNLAEASSSGLGAQPLVEPIVESVTYDADRRPTLRTDGRLKVWEMRYDGYGRMRETVDPLGNRSAITYDDHGNPKVRKAFAPDGSLLAESSSVYDLLDRSIEATRWVWKGEVLGSERPAEARAVVDHFEYDPTSKLIRHTDPLDRVSENRFDAAERLRETEDAAGNLRQLIYDRGSNVVEQRDIELDPEGNAVTVTSTATYDALGRPKSQSDALGNTTELQLDARGLPRLVIDPEGYFTRATFDGLDRKTVETRPEGIQIERGFDKLSRLVSYEDALGNETSWAYDALSRRVRATYPDGKFEDYAYDASHNLIQRVDQRGTRVDQVFDDANRMISRTAVAADGDQLAGPLAETFEYDGLYRLVRAQSGEVVSERDYDSLSRLVADTTAGKTVTYELDDVGNVSETSYPSGHAVSRQFDSLNRPSAITGPGQQALASFGYRGRFLLQDKTLGSGITSTTSFDAARRPLVKTQAGADGVPALEERFAWSPRGLKVGQSRGDLNQVGTAFAYDGAGRLTIAAEKPDPLAEIANNSAPQPSALANEPEAQRFTYDAAQNLVSKIEVTYGVAETTALPTDGSGRNRPGSVDGQGLVWDANGNLIEKGDLRFAYDFRNRLTRVTDSLDAEVARYTYDVFNRRIKVEEGAEVRESVWDGWRSIEDYEGGVLAGRRTYGLRLDEMVSMERDLDGDGTLEQSYIPLYDATGNMSVVTDINGKPLERYDLDAFGGLEILVDLTPPEVEQLRTAGDAVVLEMSEELLASRLAAGIGSGDLTLYNVTADEAMPVTVAQPVQRGPQARQRLMITTTDPPTAGDEVRLTLEPAAAVDLFHNRLASTFTQTFSWPAADTVLQDTAAPEVSLVVVCDGVVEIIFSEAVEPSTAASAIQINGSGVSWAAGSDSYTVVAQAALAAGSYDLTIGTQPLDLAGTGLIEAFAQTISVQESKPELIAYERPDPRETSDTTIGNDYGFHGLPKDSITGLLYVRNRYYDPELGRFISADPLGYVDGPSMYQFAGYDPFNSADPLGLCEGCGALIRWTNFFRTGKVPEDVKEKARNVGKAVAKEAAITLVEEGSPAGVVNGFSGGFGYDALRGEKVEGWDKLLSFASVIPGIPSGLRKGDDVADALRKKPDGPSKPSGGGGG
ncbi:MAG: RHS repeat-associated core domain-containing protein, partial [Acidobacteriota bacterium]